MLCQNGLNKCVVCGCTVVHMPMYTLIGRYRESLLPINVMQNALRETPNSSGKQVMSRATGLTTLSETVEKCRRTDYNWKWVRLSAFRVHRTPPCAHMWLSVYDCGEERKAQIYLSADGMKFEFLTCLQLYLVSDKRCMPRKSLYELGFKAALEIALIFASCCTNIWNAAAVAACWRCSEKAFRGLTLQDSQQTYENERELLVFVVLLSETFCKNFPSELRLWWSCVFLVFLYSWHRRRPPPRLR